jgi:hypothetical protein
MSIPPNQLRGKIKLMQEKMVQTVLKNCTDAENTLLFFASIKILNTVIKCKIILSMTKFDLCCDYRYINSYN